MWHLKTRMGVFWVAPLPNSSDRFYLGVNDQTLGLYQDADKAAQDVHNQATGYLKWDSEAKVIAPSHIEQWADGEPQNWLNG